jgi:hypothetical protein
VFGRRRDELLTWQDVNGIIRLLMRLDENVQAIRRIAEGDDDDGEEDE